MIKEQKLITSADDLVELGIIDWDRINGTSRSSLAAMRDISSWFIGRAAYTIIDLDLHEFPQRNDFPNWKHSGKHVELAKLYWNCFYHNNGLGELNLSDEPDFYGTLKFKGEPFWGDFGKVSASVFALTTIRKMPAHALWISVLDFKTQVIIETLESLQDLFNAQILGLNND